MLKNILKLDGAQKLSKTEQKSINGSFRAPLWCDCGGYQIKAGTNGQTCGQLCANIPT